MTDLVFEFEEGKFRKTAPKYDVDLEESAQLTEQLGYKCSVVWVRGRKKKLYFKDGETHGDETELIPLDAETLKKVGIAIEETANSEFEWEVEE